MDFAGGALGSLIAFVESSRYLLLFAGAFLEGPLVMLSSGFLLRLGALDFWPMYLALVMGDFIADLCWYWVGYFGARQLILRWGRFLGVTPDVLAKMERLFNRYHLRILTISKLTMGFGTGTATLITAGMLRINYFSYAAVNLLSGLAWVLVLITVGYWFGNVYALIPSYLQAAFGVVAFVAVILILRRVSAYLASRDF